MRHGWNFLSGLLGIAVVVAAAGLLVYGLSSRGGAPLALQPVTPPAGPPRITDLRMSDTPGGAAVTAFGRNTDVVYAVFGYAGFQDTPVMVRVYDGVGRVVFETTKRHTGSGTQAVAIAAPAGRFGEDFYLTNIYFGPELLQAASVEWTVGQPPTPVPAPTETPWPTAVPPTPWPVPTVTPQPPRPTALPTAPEPLPPGLKIVYVQMVPFTIGSATLSPSGDYDTMIPAIWIADVNDPAHRRELLQILRHRGGGGLQAALSPDGRKIAYTLLESSKAGPSLNDASLWVYDLESRQQRQLADGIFVGLKGNYPVWSPGSDAIIYTKVYEVGEMGAPDYSLSSELWLTESASNSSRQLLRDQGDLLPLGWSFDGMLVYIRYGRDCFVGALNLETKEVQAITALECSAVLPVISPNGKQVAVETVAKQQAAHAIKVFNLEDLTESTVLPDVPGGGFYGDYFPTWSADGSQLTLSVATGEGNNSTLITIEVPGQQRRPILGVDLVGRGINTPLAWSPDGKWLLLRHHGEGEMYALSQESGRIVEIPGRGLFIGWLNIQQERSAP